MTNIVVFASGSGTNFQAIIDAIKRGDLTARISGLIASKPGIGAIERAVHHGIPYVIMNDKDFSNFDVFTDTLLDQLRRWETELIVLAGYIRKVPAKIIQEYEGRMLNIHPALLPKYGGKGYYGIKVHQAVIENGETESGVTIHQVNEKYDEGPILAQERVEVNPEDTPESLAKRIREIEQSLYPRIIQEVINKLD